MHNELPSSAAPHASGVARSRLAPRSAGASAAQERSMQGIQEPARGLGPGDADGDEE